MEERYKTLVQLPRNQYLPGGPVMLLGGKLLGDAQTGAAVLRLKFYNLAYYGILDMQVRIRLEDGAGNVQQLDYYYGDLAANTDEVFGQQEAIALPGSGYCRCTVAVAAVTFADNSVWKNETMAEFAPLPKQQRMEALLHDDVLMEQYRRDTSSQAKYLPVVHKELWQCTCGGINSPYAPRCLRCGVALEDLKQITSRTDLVKEHRKFRRRRRNFRRMNHDRRRFTALALAILVVVLAGLLGISKWSRDRRDARLEPFREAAFQQYKTMVLEDIGMTEGEGLQFSVDYRSEQVKNGRFAIQGEYLCDFGQAVSHLPFTLTGDLNTMEQELVLGEDYLTKK